MKSFVELLAKGIVEHPDSVDVNELDVEGTTVLELRVADGDLGKVIGKQGRIAKAMRSLLSVAAKRKNRRAALEILE